MLQGAQLLQKPEQPTVFCPHRSNKHLHGVVQHCKECSVPQHPDSSSEVAQVVTQSSFTVTNNPEVVLALQDSFSSATVFKRKCHVSLYLQVETGGIEGLGKEKN